MAASLTVLSIASPSSADQATAVHERHTISSAYVKHLVIERLEWTCLAGGGKTIGTTDLRLPSRLGIEENALITGCSKRLAFSPAQPWRAKTCHLPGRGPSDSPTSPEGVGRLFFTARIERPPLYRGGSASKKNGLPAPSHSSEAARCASTGIVPATPSSLFSILLDASACIFEGQVPRLNETNIR